MEFLPPKVLEDIFSYLAPRDLCVIELVSKSWRVLGEKEKNYVWWKLAQRELWSNNAPEAMTKRDRKKNWKCEYAQIVPQKKQTVFVKKNGLSKSSKEESPTTQQKQRGWETGRHTKKEMREYYKMLRNKKPRGKKSCKRQRKNSQRRP